MFSGETYSETLDRERLSSQLGRVWSVMKDGAWRTLWEISQEMGSNDSEAAISARLRDFRKTRFGSHTVGRRRRGDPKSGLFEYRLTPSSLGHGLNEIKPAQITLIRRALRRYVRDDVCQCSAARKVLKKGERCKLCEALAAL